MNKSMEKSVIIMIIIHNKYMYRLDPIKTYNNNIFSKVEKSKVTLENLLNNSIQYQNTSTIVYLIYRIILQALENQTYCLAWF